MMKKLLSVIIEIDPGGNFPDRNDAGKVMSSSSDGGGEAHLRYTADLRPAHLRGRRRHRRSCCRRVANT